jgi:hypothetical protein
VTNLSAVDPEPGAELTRRLVLGGALGAAGVALLGARPAAAAGPPVIGRIRSTYEAAGGAAVLGRPLARELKVRIDGRNTYGQRFEHGTVWWGSGVGKVDRPGARVRLDTGRNFRPVLGVRDVWRSDDLDGCTPLEERVVADLGITAMIAMNTGGDPSIRGVRRWSYPISNAGSHLAFYRGYVTRASSRRAVGRVVRRVGRTEGAVLLHCIAGKDRTGWASELLQTLAGVDERTRDEGYLATRDYSGRRVELEWLQASRDALAERYGTPERYLRDGCGLSAADLRRVRARLG